MNDITEVENHLLTVFDGTVTLWLVLAVAFGAGVMHAVAPGHGKSVTAAYLVGTRSRYRHALRLGVIVALMHALSVLGLALAWVGLSTATIDIKPVTVWMQVVAGLLLIAVGAHLVYRHRRSPGSGHGHVGHGHGHNAKPPVDPWSRRGLITLALSGGLVPSPTAFLVLISGLLTGRALDAVLVVIAFGVGMTVTLTAVGIATIRGSAMLTARTAGTRLAARLASWLPPMAGVVVSAGGCLYLATAIAALGS